MEFLSNLLSFFKKKVGGFVLALLAAGKIHCIPKDLIKNESNVFWGDKKLKNLNKIYYSRVYEKLPHCTILTMVSGFISMVGIIIFLGHAIKELDKEKK